MHSHKAGELLADAELTVVRSSARDGTGQERETTPFGSMSARMLTGNYFTASGGNDVIGEF